MCPKKAHILFRLSKNLVEFAPAGANKMSICFVRWREHRTKHKTPGKCGICAQAAHKLCAQPGAAFSNANPAPRFAFESLSKRLFDKLEWAALGLPVFMPENAGTALLTATPEKESLFNKNA